MEEKQKIDVAVFQYGVIQDFLSAIKLNHGERERLLREKCARKWLIPHSCKTSISRSAIQRWISIYEASGGQLKSLYPKDRNDKGATRVLDGENCLMLTQLRKEMPDATVAFIMKTIKQQRACPESLVPVNSISFFPPAGSYEKKQITRRPPQV